jgi:hypothetical protein
METATRSLRQIRIETLEHLRGEVRTGYLGGASAEFAREARHQWDWSSTYAQHRTSELRDECQRQTLAEISAEIEILETISDETYERATRDIPLSYWNIPTTQLGPYAHARGIEGRPWSERFEGFPDGVSAGMSGWKWYRIGGDKLTREELDRLLGDRITGNQMAPQCAGPAQ